MSLKRLPGVENKQTHNFPSASHTSKTCSKTQCLCKSLADNNERVSLFEHALRRGMMQLSKIIFLKLFQIFQFLLNPKRVHNLSVACGL